jgi:hypothetical protein
MSSGLAGIVVVVDVVDVVVPRTGRVVVVDVDVVVEVTTVAVVGSIGHDAIATVGRIISGVMMSGSDVVVDG